MELKEIKVKKETKVLKDLLAKLELKVLKEIKDLEDHLVKMELLTS